jgi:hypothetical protein
MRRGSIAQRTRGKLLSYHLHCGNPLGQGWRGKGIAAALSRLGLSVQTALLCLTRQGGHSYGKAVRISQIRDTYAGRSASLVSWRHSHRDKHSQNPACRGRKKDPSTDAGQLSEGLRKQGRARSQQHQSCSNAHVWPASAAT